MGFFGFVPHILMVLLLIGAASLNAEDTTTDPVDGATKVPAAGEAGVVKSTESAQPAEGAATQVPSQDGAASSVVTEESDTRADEEASNTEANNGDNQPVTTVSSPVDSQTKENTRVVLPITTEGSSGNKPTVAAETSNKPAEKAIETAEAPAAPAKENAKVTTEEITTVPTTTEPPLPECDDPIAKAAEVQKCNDKIKQDSICIQIQKAVDCVDVKVDCSEEGFDHEINKYLASFENYALDHKCIITYKGKRLEQRNRPDRAAESQAQSSGSPEFSVSIFSSFAVILVGLLYSQ